jgi:hypothetical protein
MYLPPDIIGIKIERNVNVWVMYSACDMRHVCRVISLSLSPTALQPGVGLGLLQEFLPSFPV